jgi:hypothetical protein
MRRGNRAAALADLDRGLRESNSGGKEGEEGMAERRRVVVGDGKDEAGGLVRRRGGALWPAAQKEGIGVGLTRGRPGWAGFGRPNGPSNTQFYL